jgi:TetR/AcrR family transcriptional regulator, cholesterol catabolism regulator
METKKTDVIERSTQLFMRFGIKSVTMDDVARELGISKKTLYKYFTDKNELVLGILTAKIELDSNHCISCKNNSENAIDELFHISKFVLEQVGHINPVVFFDLKKYHPEGWELMRNHKWNFILNSIRENTQRGIQEGLFRADLDIEITSRLYVATTDIIMEGSVFPWPEFKFDKVFSEIIQFHIRGLLNEKGLVYFNNQNNQKTNV